MLVRTQRMLPLGSRVEMSLHLGAGMKPIAGRGSIARVAGANQMGIQMDALAATESEQLEEFLLQLVPEVNQKMAERVGFEPTVEFPPRSLSRRVLSTAQSPLRGQ